MTSRFYTSSALPTVLSSAVGASGNPSVLSLPGTWPSSFPYPVLLDWGLPSQEAILVTSAPTGTGPYVLPCTRGIDGTTAQAHNAGASVVHGTTGYEPTLLQASTAAIAALGGVPQGQLVLYSGNYVQGGDPDATASINRAIDAAPDGGVVLLPNGTVTVSGNGISPGGTNVELRGQAGTVIQPSGSMTALIYPLAAASGFRITNLTFDGLFEAAYLIYLPGGTVQGLTCTNVTFRNPAGGAGVDLVSVSGAVFDYCTFTGNSQTGLPSGTMCELVNGARRIKFSYCTFESYVNGIIGASGSEPYNTMIDDVEIDHCYFNGSWFLIPPGTMAQVGTPSGSGGTVTYTATTVTDTSAAFATMPQPSAYANNIRAMPVRHTGTITSDGELYLTDSAANFNAALSYGNATIGDIVRTPEAWAMVEGIESGGTALRVSPWRSLTTWQLTSVPPASTAYTLYALIIGNVMSYTGTQITVDRWHDWYGNSVNPPAGTLYEVLAPRPNYAVNFNQGSWNTRVTGCEFFANWSDQCSTYGVEAQIIGNYIHDGQDGGITCQGGDRMIVAANRVRHQGAAGMFLWSSNSACEGNVFEGAGWVNGDTGAAMDIWLSGNANIISGNTFVSDATVAAVPAQNYGIYMSSASAGNVISVSNTYGGHAVADIYITGSGLGVSQIGVPAGATALYAAGAVPQLLSYTGTGAPSLTAAVGSQYTQTDAGAGGPGWTYTASGWQQGLSGGFVPGNLSVGGSLSSYGGFSSSSVATPTGLTVTPTGGTGSTTYGYKVAGVVGESATAPTSEVTVTNGVATLSGTQYNALSWSASANALAYNVYGRVSGSESLLAQVTGTSYNDTGAAAPAAARNLLTLTGITPSFYGGSLNDWGVNLSGHSTLAADGTTGPNANSCSMRVTTDGTSSAGFICGASAGPVPASGGGAYTLSFYAKGSGTLEIFLNSTPAFAGFVSNPSIALTGTWTRYSITGTCPASQTHLYVTGIMNSANTFWVSCFQIEAGSSATAYIDTTAAVATPASGAQFVAQAWPSQTGDPFLVENSAGGNLFTVDPSGNCAATSSVTTPVLIQPRATQTLASAGAVTINAASGDAVITLEANASSSTITNPVADQILRITWIQDATGSRTYAWPSNCYFAANTAPSDPLTASTRTTVTFRYDASGSAWHELDRAVSVG